MKKYILFILIFSFASFFSQISSVKYYIEFKSQKFKPSVYNQRDNNLILVNKKGNRNFARKYSDPFYNYRSDKLKNTSLIEFSNSVDFQNFIINNSEDISNYEKVESINPIDVLLIDNANPSQNISTLNSNDNFFSSNSYFPNDYYLIQQDIAHTHLDLINAQEAWNYSKGDGITIGVSDTNFRVTHKEFIGKISVLPNDYNTNYDYQDWYYSHGNMVAGLAAANTDNNFGASSIGYNSNLLVTTSMSTGSWSRLKEMSDLGAKVINMSWLSSCSPLSYEQDAINEIYNQGTVLVAAAGNNTTCGNSYSYVYPASYENVISVSGVGHLNDINSGITTNVKDVHYYDYSIQKNNTQNNDAVDIVAPSYDMLGMPYNHCDTCIGMVWSGTSLATPIVSGTVALLFSSNNSLNPLEIESIIKLSSANIEQLTPNAPFKGLLGAGRIDAGKANKIAWQMNSNNGGEIALSNKNFNRWHFELINSPEKIRIFNESFTENSDITFKAKKYILLESNVLLSPGTGKKDYLYINNNNTCYTPIINNIGAKMTNTNNEIFENNNLIDIYPNPVSDLLYIKIPYNLKFKNFRVNIYDMSYRKIISREINKNDSNINIDISKMNSGNYFIEVLNNNKKIHFQKILKK